MYPALELIFVIVRLFCEKTGETIRFAIPRIDETIRKTATN